MSPREISKAHAKTCQVFANAHRIEIIEALVEKERSTEELAKILKTTPPNVSQHLKMMRDRGVIVSKRKEHQVLNSLANDKIIKLFLLERQILSEILQSAASIFDEETTSEAEVKKLD